MTITVRVKNGRLTIFENGHLVRDGGRDIIQALTDGQKIFTLQLDGHAREIRKDGQLVKDYAVRAVHMELSGGSLFLTTKDGRRQEFVGGQMVSNHGVRNGTRSLTGKSSSMSNRSNAGASGDKYVEQLGAKLGDILVDVIIKAGKHMFKAIGESLGRKARASNCTEILTQDVCDKQRSPTPPEDASFQVDEGARRQGLFDSSEVSMSPTEMPEKYSVNIFDALKRFDKEVIGIG